MKFIEDIGKFSFFFILPFWTQFLVITFNNPINQKEFNQSAYFAFFILLTILLTIFFILYLRDYVFKGILESESSKMKKISEELLNLKWNIKLDMARKSQIE